MKNNIRKNLIAISACLLFALAVQAQESKQEVSFSVGGGISSLSYDANIGEQKSKTGGNFAIGYTYFFIPNLGISSGAEFSLYKSELKADKFNNVIQDIVDPSDSELYDRHTLMRDYKESQDAMYINIPLMLQYQMGDINKFYISAGAKLGIPVKGKYKSSALEMTNKGFFHNTANWGETQEFMGFGTIADYSNNENIDFKVACLLSVEAGMKWRLNSKLYLYTGAYVDYGVNDIVKGGHSQSFIKVEDGVDAPTISNNSVLNSSIGYSSNTLTQTMTEKVRPISIGVKVRLAINL